ncbi:MAG TPA: tetratricopeptide repeat protein, partial [Bryobacteraceae bacterium]
MLALSLPAVRAQRPELRDAVAALQSGDYQAAEKKLRAEVAAHPDDALVLSLLASALDNLSKPGEAGAFHRRAVAKAPRSPEILNNYAAHLWMSGDEREAAKIYERLLAVDPAHYNANLQLARLALKENKPADALRRLDRIPPGQRDTPQVLLPRVQALYLAGDSAAANSAVSRLEELSRSDPNLAFAAGMTLSQSRHYEKAQAFFETALKADPANFNVLYNLGISAMQAGRYDRARDALDAAYRQQPRNLDVLYGLAYAEARLRKFERAVQLLAQGEKIDPRRADIQKLLALTTADLGALDDSAAAWDRYLKLQPNDPLAQRERAYTLAQLGQLDDAVPELEKYVAAHPNDPIGHYELGQAERTRDIGKALAEFDRSLVLDPDYVPARSARGGVYYQQGKPELAVKDLEAAASLRPDDAANLDRLGQT